MMKVPKGSGFHNTLSSWGKMLLIQTFQVHNQVFWALLFQDKPTGITVSAKSLGGDLGEKKNLSNTQGCLLLNQLYANKEFFK